MSDATIRLLPQVTLMDGAHPFVVVFFLFRCIFQVKASDSERRWEVTHDESLRTLRSIARGAASISLGPSAAQAGGFLDQASAK